jgi:hypothetical protein
VADAFGQRTGSLTADLDEAGIAGDLVERWEGTLWFGQEFVVQVGFELQEGVVDAEAVVLHSPLKQRDQFLLTGQAFENLHQLSSG